MVNAKTVNSHQNHEGPGEYFDEYNSKN